jgi:acetyltransferase-like isoleucine patch superfamily enzyme
MIDDGVVLDAKGATSRIELGNQILLGRQSILSCNEAQIRIGNFVSIGPFCFFACKSRIEIGSNVSIGSGAHFMAGGHVSDDPDTPIIHQARSAKGITIEDGAWVGTGAIILDGVNVGRNSIVGAGAVVSKDVPAWTVVLGNPARVVQKRKETAQI